jgi:glycosyltransferase involved in cell wall biosynthesis
MKISIITVCFNSKKTIRQTIESVLYQTYENIEFIIIDGGSTDGTLGVIDEYSNKISKFISEPDLGIYDAINKGIRLASGDFIGIVNSDDFFSSNVVIETLVNKIKKNPEVGLVFSFVDIISNKNQSKVIRNYKVQEYSKRMMRIGVMPAHPTTLVSRLIYKRLGPNPYRTDLRIAADYELLLRILLKINPSWVCLPIISMKMRSGGVSNNGILSKIQLNREILRACKLNNFYTNSFLLMMKIFIRFGELMPNLFRRVN